MKAAKRKREREVGGKGEMTGRKGSEIERERERDCESERERGSIKA